MTWTLVTGGAKRLGAEIALALAKKGHSLVIHYHHSKGPALELVEKCKQFGVDAECIQGDFSSVKMVEDFIVRYLDNFSETENLINNVGNYLIKPALETTIEEWTSLFQVNLHAPFALCRALSPSIIKYRGNIVNIGVAKLGGISANTYSTAYSITKSALWMLTKSLAAELATSHARANMVSPGYLDIAVDVPSDLEKLPMHRAGKSCEVARVVSFLLEKESAYITGQNIEVAGGFGLK